MSNVMQWFNHSLILLFLCMPLMATNGMFPISMGVEAGGRGGVDLGIASDPSCINTNPAGLGFLHGKMMELTLGAYFPSIEFSNSVNDTRSNFEPVPFGSFAIVWDKPDDVVDAFLDPWRFTFGADVQTTEYVYYSGSRPYAANLAPAQGTGAFEWEFTSSSYDLEIKGTQGCKIRDIQIFLHSNAEQSFCITSSSIPSLSSATKITSITAKFTWRNPQATSKAQIKLIVDGLVETMNCSQGSDQEQPGYMVLIWAKDTPPAAIQLAASQGMVLENPEVLLGYELNDSYYWAKVEMLQSSMRIMTQDSQTYEIADSSPQRIPLAQLLQNISPNSKIQLAYSYALANQNAARIEISLIQADSKIIATKTHIRSYQEPSPQMPVCRREADHETPQPDRSSGWKFGLGIFPQAGARYTMKVKSDDFFMDGVENRTDMMFVSIAPGIAYRFGDRLSIGVALNLNWETLELDGLVAQSSLILKGKPIQGTNTTFGQYLIGVRDVYNIKGEIDSDALMGFGVGGRLGILWKVNDRLQIGAMYSPRTWMTEAKGQTKLDFNRHFSQIDVANIAQILLPRQGQDGFSGKYDIKIDFDLPQQAGIGFSYLIADNLLFACDFRWIDYSDTQFALRAKVSNGTNLDLNALVGASDAKVTFKVGWKDQYVLAVGMVWQPAPEWICRVGYNYSNNPMPEEYLNPQLAAISEHHVTLGASYVVSRTISLHGALECSLPSDLQSGSENLVHEKYVHSELETFTIGALLGMTMRF